MFIETIKHRINDYKQLTGYYKQNKNSCNPEMDVAVRTAVMSIAVLVFLYMVLFFLSIYYSFKCAKLMKWQPYIPFLLVLSTFTPLYGGYFMIGIVIYGMINCSE